MRKATMMLGIWLACALGGRADVAADSARLEAEIAALVAAKDVTVVHFWAPWCSNCKAELGADGWAKFVNDHPGVNVVFLNVWHKGQDGAEKLAVAGLGGQANFVARTHPNGSSLRGEKLDQFLGLPVSWVPTTWVFRDGKLRYAVNYGELRFEMLRQMVEDAAAKW